MFGGTMVHYQNANAQYLAPDSTATPLTIHWLVREVETSNHSSKHFGNKENYLNFLSKKFSSGIHVSIPFDIFFN
jgi:hypothetical protein